MKLIPSEPDLATLFARIERKDLDLQPGFQRQEVWPDAKKRRLIDTILRGWHVPPIHVVEVSEARKEVLDGQQRLVAIREFMSDRLRVDGRIPPPDSRIEKLHNLRYTELPEEVRRRFDSYSIRLITLSEYSPEEPGELFYRLNQQTSLTPPEQRNAFFGPARDQVRELVHECEIAGLDKRSVGFTNSRMAYDDVIARFCEALESRTLRRKTTAAAITDRYRSRNPFSEETIKRARRGLHSLIHILSARRRDFALNKATAHSWLCFLAAFEAECAPISEAKDPYFVESFETTRALLRASQSTSSEYKDWSGLGPTTTVLLRLYNDRASSRVADVSSVLVRDYATWVLFRGYRRTVGLPIEESPARRTLLNQCNRLLRDGADPADQADSLGQALERDEWGIVL